jgi:thiol-disulfide isomerase/thioredoxin
MINIKTQADMANLLMLHDKVLVIFTQPSWCVPCQHLEPHLQAADAKTDIPFAVIDEASDFELYSAWNVLGVPQMFLIDGENSPVKITARTSMTILNQIETGT